MYSPTAESLRSMVEKLAESITEKERVVVVPGDMWAAFPHTDPPKIVYKLEDVGVMGEEETLGVTAHEIAHLLYTTEVDFPFDISKRPRAAYNLFNAVEDARIERQFAERYPGAQSLFDGLRSDTYDAKVQRGFDDLPVKWRFVLNIDRVCHGLEPWGSQLDIDAVELVLDDVIEAMLEDTCQEAVTHLEKPYQVLLDLMRKEILDDDPRLGDNMNVPLMVPPEWLGLPPDYTPVRGLMEDEQEGGMRTGERTDHAFDQGASEDDHKVGGTDGTDGKREKADGSQGGSVGEGSTGIGEGDSSEGADGGSGTGGDGAQGSSTTADSRGGGGGGNDPLDAVTEEPSRTKPDAPGVKPTNIIDEMVQEEAHSGNKAVDILSYRAKKRAQEAKKIEQRIREEERDYLGQLEAIFNKGRSSEDFRKRMAANEKRYREDLATFRHQIIALRNHAQNVLRDNAMERFGGNKTSGRKIKTSRLYRTATQDPRLFERKEYIGGKSYDIGLVIDQSSSMRGHQQELTYHAALIFLEAFEGLAGTAVNGFSDMGYENMSVMDGYAGYYQRYDPPGKAILSRTYKEVDSDLLLRRAALPELCNSFASTPMEAGVAAMTEQLRHSMKEVKAMIIISDGEPNNPRDARAQIRLAQQVGIMTYGLHIPDSMPYGINVGYLDAGYKFLIDSCDRAAQVYKADEVPAAVNSMLRGIIRTRRAS